MNKEELKEYQKTVRAMDQDERLSELRSLLEELEELQEHHVEIKEKMTVLENNSEDIPNGA